MLQADYVSFDLEILEKKRREPSHFPVHIYIFLCLEKESKAHLKYKYTKAKKLLKHETKSHDEKRR